MKRLKVLDSEPDVPGHVYTGGWFGNIEPAAGYSRTRDKYRAYYRHIWQSKSDAEQDCMQLVSQNNPPRFHVFAVSDDRGQVEGLQNYVDSARSKGIEYHYLSRPKSKNCVTFVTDGMVNAGILTNRLALDGNEPSPLELLKLMQGLAIEDDSIEYWIEELTLTSFKRLDP